MASLADLVVFSHLRWDFVFQRPQHVLSRIARTRPVVFIEEPVLDEQNAPYLDITQVDEKLVVVRPHTPINEPGFSGAQMPILHELLTRFMEDRQVRRCAAWFYTPLAMPLLEALPYELVVYDCMDALDAFLNAPALLKQREQELLDAADVVFTGGPSLYRRLKNRHSNVYCFPSSVDAKHFAQARAMEEGMLEGGLREPSDQQSIAFPRLGYFGVIDERIDLALIDSVASQHPHWQIIMVGPVVKISEAMLPRRDNIHYLGQKHYAELPDYLRGWDVCLLPFAQNESTRFISPTKTLEYMAAEKPIVGTPITDVAVPYGHIVPIESDPVRFAAACQEALVEPAAKREQRVAAMREVLATTSWDNTANQMQSLLEEGLALKTTPAASGSSARSAKVETQSKYSAHPDSDQQGAGSHHPVIVVGAGPTGLSAAYHLGKEALLIDQNDKIGGWCRSLESDGFTFDFAGHIMFSNDPYVHDLYKMLLGDNVHWQDREAWVYSKSTYTRYPFQGALYGLPADVIKECILGAVEARYGIAKELGNSSPKPAPSGPSTAASPSQSVKQSNVCHEGDVKDCCGDGVLESTAKLVKLPASNGSSQDSAASRLGESAALSPNGASNGSSNGASNGAPQNFEEFIYKVWGAGIAKHFAIPYNRKLWAVPLSEMETSWLGGRVPMPDLGEMLEGSLKPVGKPMGPNARFGYPLRGGFQALMDGFLPHISDQLVLGKKVVKVSSSEKRITLDDGQVLSYEQLVSTMPLPVLIRLMGSEVPLAVQTAAKGLRHVSVRCVNLGIGRENLTEKHWIYYPEQTVFHRIFVQGNASPHCNPPGGFGLTCEITYSPHKPLPCDGDALVQRCIDDCRSVGMIREEDPVWTSNQVDMPYAYVVYDHARPKNVALIREWLKSQDIVLSGRYSEWEYYNSDHAFLAGKKAADEVLSTRSSRPIVGLAVSSLGDSMPSISIGKSSTPRNA